MKAKPITRHNDRHTDQTEQLQMALLGYELVYGAIGQKIKDLRKQLTTRGGNRLITILSELEMLPAVNRPAGASSPANAAPRKHRISAEGRARIAAAQVKRWANARKNKPAKAA